MPIDPNTGMLINGTTTNPMTGQVYGAANIDPMTGQLVQSGQPVSGPIGSQPSKAQSNESKFMNMALGGGAFLASVKYSSHSRLLASGPSRSRAMRRLKMEKTMHKSLTAATTTTSGMKPMWEDFKREKITQFNPFTWRTAPSFKAFDPDTARQEYAITNGILKMTRLNKLKFLEKHKIVDDKGEAKHIFDPHFASRISAAKAQSRRVAKMGEKTSKDGSLLRDATLDKKSKQDLAEYLYHANPQLLAEMVKSGSLDRVTEKEVSSIIRMSMQHSMTGRYGAFSQGVMHPGSIGSESDLLKGPFADMYRSGEAYGLTSDIYKTEGKAGVAALKGMSLAELEAKGFGKKEAAKIIEKGAVSPFKSSAVKLAVSVPEDFIPIVDVAVAAYQAYTLVKMGIEAVEMGANAAGTIAKEVMGGINKPQFGGGYTDTLAASTSRSRGVSAIQNSRLNARSVLGTEAASIHQHFR